MHISRIRQICTLISSLNSLSTLQQECFRGLPEKCILETFFVPARKGGGTIDYRI